MTLKFDPPKEVSLYAAYVEGIGMSLYKEIGTAKNALRHKVGFWGDKAYRNGLLLKNIEGQWFILHEIKKGDARPPWYKEVESYGYEFDTSRNEYKKRKSWKAKPLTNEEYAEWRLRVEKELNPPQPSVTVKTTDINTLGTYSY